MPTIVKHVDKKSGTTRVSSGRKGRTPSRKNVPTSDDASELAKQVERLQKAAAGKDEEILSLKNEVCRLKSVIKVYRKVCEAISADLGKAPSVHEQD